WRRRGLGGSVAVGRSTLPAALAAEIIPMELLVHGWDVARATGSQIEVPAEVASHLLGCAHSLVTPDKRGRSFAAEVPVGPSATVLERLIAFTGRQP
ncbi:MAG TPA: TIGR03086 family protein, partial [Streptosporangiaceae bacterium]|nr:TIGR03086 family protein [Streptosporangiaceae bacterium]